MGRSTKEIIRVSRDKRYAPKGLGSAIRWLTYYLNRGGKSLDPVQRRRIEKARDELQKINKSGPYARTSPRKLNRSSRKVRVTSRRPVKSRRRRLMEASGKIKK